LVKIKVGEKARNFCLPDAENRSRSLGEFLGQKVVLVFSVESFTLDSTKELCLFRDAMSQLTNLHAQVVGVDANPPEANKALAAKHRLHFPILSDGGLEVNKAFGLAKEDAAGKLLAKRAIVVLSEDGTVLYEWVAQDTFDEPDYEEIQGFLKPTVRKEHASMVKPTVITFSRQIGSGGDEIARHVSQMLGWAYVDKSLVVEVGRSLGYHEEDIVDFCEDTYRVQTFVDKLMVRRTAKASINMEGDIHIRKFLDEEQCLATVQSVINNLAGRGNTVIVGRGGQAILKHKVGALHIRVIAPPEVRLQRIMRSESVGELDAQRMMEENDRAASEYLRRFYGIDWNDPVNYDLVLNTAKLDLSTAALLISQAASQT
jgi:peroxiredoxin/cytidylate kinase